jgi:hypothetical protein
MVASTAADGTSFVHPLRGESWEVVTGSRCLLIDVIDIRNESIAGQVDEENSISLCGRHSIVENAGHTAAMAPKVAC